MWLAALGLLLANAYFVGAEFATMAVRRSQVEPRAAAGSWAARLVVYALEHMPSMLATLQLGVTVASTSLGAVAEGALASALTEPIARAGLPHATSHALAAAAALIAVVYLHVVLGEMVPKNLALAAPERAALILTPALVVLAWALTPVTAALRGIAHLALRALRVTPKTEVASAFTAVELAAIVHHSTRAGVLPDADGLISGSLEFSTKTAGDVMVGEADLVVVAPGVTPGELEACVARTGFSRFPIRQPAGQLTGYLHIQDVLDLTGPDRRALPVPAGRVRPIIAAEACDEVEDILATMQLTGSHLVAVPGGVVFMEDVLEELVGEVKDAMQRAAAPRPRGPR
ncbi:MAG: CNNM domain-containing protein [Bifidobacteriaceae bacterium]|jgi:CBS domain containing-hemolysin-like protein|nr:CNNM domain-containing protein [Bifidobacteriaceae bacterium]